MFLVSGRGLMVEETSRFGRLDIRIAFDAVTNDA